VYTLDRATLIKAPLDEVFRFFEDPRNLAKITPKGMGFDITHIDGLPVTPGFRIEYTIRVRGVPVRWVTQIPIYEPPNRFVISRRRGHTGRGGTSIRLKITTVRPLCEIACSTSFVRYSWQGHSRMVVSRQLRDIFDFRRRKIRKMFGAPVATI
jgi:hypothetical protein